MDTLDIPEADAANSVATARDERSFDRLARLGIVAWEQVLLYLPTGFHDYTSVSERLPETLVPIEKGCYSLKVISTPNKAAIEPPRVSFNVSDGYTTARVTVFGNVWNWLLLEKGDQVVIEGQIGLWEGNLQINNPTLVPNWMAGKVVPIYRGKRGRSKKETISPEFVLEKTREALKSKVDGTVDYLVRNFPGLTEESIVQQAALPYSIARMLRTIHAPLSVEAGEQALLAAHALAAFEIVFRAKQQAYRKPSSASVINIKQKDIDTLIAKFPYPLTDDQLAAIEDIVKDLRLPYPMKRLLSGDVGFGKTDAALIPALAALFAGAKVCILCPSTLIADQWVEKIRQYGKFPVLEVNSGLKKKTSEIKEILKENPILVGTTALVHRVKKYNWMPTLLITDEEHKHGMRHKEALTASHTNNLDATATCLPRTGALVFYGGMSQSILNQCPVKKNIVPRIVQHDEKGRMFAHMKRVLEEVPDAQFAVVYPKLSKSDDKTSLMQAAEGWEKLFPGQIGILHGKLEDAEKTEVIARMKRGEIRILLSTILLETGITIPSLRGLIVVDAKHMGVTQLHQLRGRIARLGGKGYFYMYLPDEADEDTLTRLQLLIDHSDGFELAEKDAELRGYGSLDDEESDQSGVSCSALFFGMRLMPQDIKAAIERN